MTPNSRAIALILSLLISGFSTLIISLHPDSTKTIVITTFVSSLSLGFILIRITTEYLFFREIKNIYNALKQIQDKDLSFLARQKKSSINPLRRVSREIYNYAGQKQNEIDELKRMEAFRREFMADVSHELKTPIFAAQGFVHTLLDGAVEDKSVRKKFLKKAAKSLDGLDALVQDLITISQMETGDIKMKFDSFNIVELIQDVIEQLEDRAQKKAMAVKLEHDPDRIFVYADYQRMYQVMSNLISNAIKYTGDGGWVRIKVDEGVADVTVSVKDNGMGIPKEDIGRIFERFYRVDKSRSKASGGTGLGLSIVKHIMEAHDSKISVTSKPEKGSMFWFKLEKGEPTKAKTWTEHEEYS